MSIIAVSTNKGGVLKTSLTTNLAGAIAEQGKRVLIIDTDNQGNTLVAFGKNPDKLKYTLYDVLVEALPAKDAVVNVHRNIDVLPSNDDMSFLEFDILPDISKYPNPFKLLKVATAEVVKQYDYVLIDTPPTLGLVQGNVLSMVDGVIIPFQPEGFSMRSLTKIIRAIHNFKEKQNPNLKIMGVVGTLVDQRTTLHSQVLQECRKYCQKNGIHMFDTVIPKSIRFAASVSYEKKPATLVDKKNPTVAFYYELLEEVLGIGAKR